MRSNIVKNTPLKISVSDMKDLWYMTEWCVLLFSWFEPVRIYCTHVQRFNESSSDRFSPAWSGSRCQRNDRGKCRRPRVRIWVYRMCEASILSFFSFRDEGHSYFIQYKRLCEC